MFGSAPSPNVIDANVPSTFPVSITRYSSNNLLFEGNAHDIDNLFKNHLTFMAYPGFTGTEQIFVATLDSPQGRPAIDTFDINVIPPPSGPYALNDI